jgi:ProP effector
MAETSLLSAQLPQTPISDSPVELPLADPAEPLPVASDRPSCEQRLRERFPALFAQQVRPLKLRIQADIQKEAPGVFSSRELSAFLHRYTRAGLYLKSLLQFRERFDLLGLPAGEVSPEHVQAARDELQRRRSIGLERQAQQAQERQERIGLLHAFESTSLTRANFCALKGLEESALDSLLEQARQDLAHDEQPLRQQLPHKHNHKPHGQQRQGPREQAAAPARQEHRARKAAQ